MSEQDDYYNESAVTPGCRHLRLRDGQTIRGYKRIHDNGQILFSKDNFWWTSQSIDHTGEDRSSELLDINRQMIFEHDALQIRGAHGNILYGLVVWNDREKELLISLINSDNIYPLTPMDATAPFCDHLKVTGQIFPDQ